MDAYEHLALGDTVLVKGSDQEGLLTGIEGNKVLVNLGQGVAELNHVDVVRKSDIVLINGLPYAWDWSNTAEKMEITRALNIPNRMLDYTWAEIPTVCKSTRKAPDTVPVQPVSRRLQGSVRGGWGELTSVYEYGHDPYCRGCGVVLKSEQDIKDHSQICYRHEIVQP